MSLLGHSMGDYALSFAVDSWFRNSSAPNHPLFDEIILAAADEKATTFAPPDGRLRNLYRLGREITVYFNNDDILMELSHRANNDLFDQFFGSDPGYR